MYNEAPNLKFCILIQHTLQKWVWSGCISKPVVRFPRSCKRVARGEPARTTFRAPRSARGLCSLEAAPRTPWLLSSSPELPTRGHACRLLGQSHPRRKGGLLSGHSYRLSQPCSLRLPHELSASHGISLAARMGGSSARSWRGVGALAPCSGLLPELLLDLWHWRVPVGCPRR